jgi:hypothetical protein
VMFRFFIATASNVVKKSDPDNLVIAYWLPSAFSAFFCQAPLVEKVS